MRAVDRLRNMSGFKRRTFVPSSWDKVTGKLAAGVLVDVQPRERWNSPDSCGDETFLSITDPNRRYVEDGHTLGRLGERDAIELALFILANVPPRAIARVRKAVAS